MKNKKVDKWIKRGMDCNELATRFRFSGSEEPYRRPTLMIEVRASDSFEYPVEAEARGFGLSCMGTTVHSAIDALLESVADHVRMEVPR